MKFAKAIAGLIGRRTRTPPIAAGPSVHEALTEHFGTTTFDEVTGESFEGRQFVDMSENCKAWIGCTFTDCLLAPPGAHFFFGCRFVRCTIGRAQYRSGTTYRMCVFESTEFEGTFIGPVFIEGEFRTNRFSHRTTFSRYFRLDRVRGLETSAGLEAVKTEGKVDELSDDLRYATLPWWCKCWSPWASLRSVGSLPFFGISYAAFPALVALIAVVNVYNEQVTVWHAAAQARASDPSVLEHWSRSMRRITLSYETVVLLLSSVLLMIASTIYALRCPDRIKEFSLERWETELGNHACNYVPLSWRYPVYRWIALVCYALGRTGALLILVWRLIVALQQAWRNLA